MPPKKKKSMVSKVKSKVKKVVRKTKAKISSALKAGRGRRLRKTGNVTYAGSGRKVKKLANARVRGKVKRGVTGAKVTTKGGAFPTYKKKSKTGKSFAAAFKAAKGKNFTWHGRRYSGKRKTAASKKK